MGKGGKYSNPIHSRNAENTAAETGRAETTEGDAVRACFEAGAWVAVELRLTAVSLLLEVAIGAGSLRFEREVFTERERFSGRG